MPDSTRTLISAILALVLTVATGSVMAQSKGGGKIVCWKDKSGKTVGCGDTVPPEYQNNATKELDKRGVTRKTTDSAEDAAKRKTQQQELARQQEEEQKRLADQKRQDTALINTFTSEKEIDAKRDRDMQVFDLQISQLKVSLKNATEHQAELKTRSEGYEKNNKPVPDNVKGEMARAAAEKQKIEQSIAAKEKEKEDIRARYAEQKKRFAELRGTQQPAAPPTPATSPAPKK